MSENEPDKFQKGWGWLQWSMLLGGVAVMAGLAISIISHFGVKRDQMRAASNLSLVFAFMRSYASEFSGHYPDFTGHDPAHEKDLPRVTSNSVFRRLVQERISYDDWGGRCPYSRFTPDGNIGTAPDHTEAFSPGENHWMLVAGLSQQSPGHYPLIMENAVEASWPPKWLPSPSLLSKWVADMRGEVPPRGRSWPDNTILIVFCDGLIKTVKLEERDGFLHLPQSILKPEGKEPLPALRILDIEELE